MSNEQDEEAQARRDELAKVESDEFTGLLPPKIEEDAFKQSVVGAIEQSDAFSNLVATKGWKILEKFVESQTEWMLRQLRIETDLEKIRRLQAEILAFESLFNVIEVSFVNAEQAKKHLLDMVSGGGDLVN